MGTHGEHWGHTECVESLRASWRPTPLGVILTPQRQKIIANTNRPSEPMAPEGTPLEPLSGLILCPLDLEAFRRGGRGDHVLTSFLAPHGPQNESKVHSPSWWGPVGYKVLIVPEIVCPKWMGRR